jgi:hypothetical protein
VIAGVGGVGQSEFLKADAALARRHLVAPDNWKKAFGQDALKVFAVQLCLDRAADEL